MKSLKLSFATLYIVLHDVSLPYLNSAMNILS